MSPNEVGDTRQQDDKRRYKSHETEMDAVGAADYERLISSSRCNYN